MLALVGEIGGFLGLILGVSLLDLKNIEAKIVVTLAGYFKFYFESHMM